MNENLDLEQDFLLTEEDFRYMEKARFERAGKVDLDTYLDRTGILIFRQD